MLELLLRGEIHSHRNTALNLRFNRKMSVAPFAKPIVISSVILRFIMLCSGTCRDLPRRLEQVQCHVHKTTYKMMMRKLSSLDFSLSFVFPAPKCQFNAPNLLTWHSLCSDMISGLVWREREWEDIKRSQLDTLFLNRQRFFSPGEETILLTFFCFDLSISLSQLNCLLPR